MNKLIPMFLCAAAMVGCKSLTPETSWSDYGRYYSPENLAGVTIVPSTTADIQTVSSRKADATIANLKTQGYVVMGKFLISDDTEITQHAVEMLAQKLGASAAVWSTENVLGAGNALPNNPAQSIAGVDTVQMAHMNENPGLGNSFADQVTTHRHTIWMLGKTK